MECSAVCTHFPGASVCIQLRHAPIPSGPQVPRRGRKRLPVLVSATVKRVAWLHRHTLLCKHLRAVARAAAACAAVTSVAIPHGLWKLGVKERSVALPRPRCNTCTKRKDPTAATATATTTATMVSGSRHAPNHNHHTPCLLLRRREHAGCGGWHQLTCAG